MSWHNKLVTYGKRHMLINDVLQCLPIYLMFTMDPPKGMIDQFTNPWLDFLGNLDS